MNYQETRVRNNLSELELAIILAVPVKDLRAFEAGRLEPTKSLKAMYEKLHDSESAFDVISEAFTRRYESIQDIKLLLQATSHFAIDDTLKGMLQVCLAKSNPQFKPEELGFRVTKIKK